MLELFALYWREFLWFESSVLLSYLSVLRKGLEEDYALANLILRKAYLANSPGSLSDLYVAPTFQRELTIQGLIGPLELNLDLLQGERYRREIDDHIGKCRRLAALLKTAPLWSQLDVDQGDRLSKSVLSVAGEMGDLWEASCQRYIARITQEARHRSQRHSPQGFAASGWIAPESSAVTPSKHDVQVALSPSEAFMEKATQLRHEVMNTSNELRRAVDVATLFAKQTHESGLDALGSPEFLVYCQIADASKAAPFAFDVSASGKRIQFSEDLLLGGHPKTGQSWSPQNRPVGTSQDKP